MKSRLLLFFFLLIFALLFSQELDTIQIRDMLAAGEQQQLATIAQEILNEDPKNAIALYALGAAQHAIEAGSEDAIKNLEKALKSDPRLLDAYLLVAEVYQNAAGDAAENTKRAERWLKKAVEQEPAFAQAWLSLARLIENDLRYDTTVQTLRDAVLANPQKVELYHAYIRKMLWYEKYGDAFAVLDAITAHMAYDHPYIIQKADIFFREGDLAEAMGLLDSLQGYIYKDTKARFYLLRAKILFEQFKDEEGQQNYWKAVASVIDSADAKIFLDDLCYIMLDSEYEQYENLKPDEFWDFMLKFWLKRDPDLATRENERLPEHYRRVFYARQNFRRFVDGRYNETLIEQEHYHSGARNPTQFDRTSTVRNASSGAWIKRGIKVQVGDDLMNNMVSQAIFENRDLDDLGLIYVKHGQWDDWETAILDQYNVVENKTVQYHRQGNRPEMLFHFVKYGEIRGWCIESLPHYYINRGRFGPDYARAERSAAMNRRSTEYEFEEYDLNQRLTEETAHDVQVALTTESSEYEPPGGEIRLPMQFLFFKDNENKIRMEWYYLLMGDRIGINASDLANYLHYKKFVGLFDSTWTEVLHAQRDEHVPVQMAPEEWHASSMVRREQIVVSPGLYYCETHIDDYETGNVVIQRDTLYAPNFYADSLCLSDILLSGTILPAEKDAQFTINDLSFRPHMFWAFDKKQPVGIYFEVYNLSPAASGTATFDVTCTLKAKDKKQSLLQKIFTRQQQEVSIVNEYEASGQDDQIYINFNFEDQKKGMYDLIVRIVDRESGEQAEKRVELELM
jgi:tetratricopeptide (TPR) repeat protein